METAQKEEWRQIADYPGYYISNLGRVKSVRILKPSESREYLGLSLTKIDIPRCRKHFSIHRLVLISFKGLDPNRCEANHINGIKTDNRLENLEWVTRSENTKHSYAIGLQIVTAKSNEKRSKALRGEKSYRAKLTEKDIPIIRQLRNDGLTYKAISQRFNVSLSTIYHVISGRGWKSS